MVSQPGEICYKDVHEAPTGSLFSGRIMSGLAPLWRLCSPRRPSHRELGDSGIPISRLEQPLDSTSAAPFAGKEGRPPAPQFASNCDATAIIPSHGPELTARQGFPQTGSVPTIPAAPSGTRNHAGSERVPAKIVSEEMPDPDLTRIFASFKGKILQPMMSLSRLSLLLFPPEHDLQSGSGSFERLFDDGNAEQELSASIERPGLLNRRPQALCFRRVGDGLQVNLEERFW